MPIEVRHDPPILFPMLAQMANTAMLGASEAEIARKQAEARQRQGLYDSIGGLVGAPIEGYFKGRQQKLLYDLSLERDAQQHEQRLEILAIDQESQESQQYREMMLKAGYVPNFDDPGLQHNIKKIDGEMLKLRNAFAAGDITLEQYNAGVRPLHRQRVAATLEAPFVKKPDPAPEWVNAIQQKGFYELPDGTKLYQSAPGKISHIAPPKSVSETETRKPIDLSELSAAQKQLAEETGSVASPQQAAERAVRNRLAVQQANMMMEAHLTPGFPMPPVQPPPVQPEPVESQISKRIISRDGRQFWVDVDERGKVSGVKPLPETADEGKAAADRMTEMIRREYDAAVKAHEKAVADAELPGDAPGPAPDIMEVSRKVMEREAAIRRAVQEQASGASVPRAMSDTEIQASILPLRSAAAQYGDDPSQWPTDVARAVAPQAERLLESLLNEIDALKQREPLTADRKASLDAAIRRYVAILEQAREGQP